MAVPAVTCAAKIVISWNTGGGTYNAALSATATNSPTGWTWTILSVPVGLEAILSGTWGDFVNGVATTGAGAASAVDLNGIPTDVVAGTIVIQAVATNGDGSSVPTTDKKNGQQCVVIKTELLDLPLPGDREYGWGQGQLDEVLRKLEGSGTRVLLYRKPLLTNLSSITAAKAAGSITVIAKANLNDGEEVAIPDGDNPTVHFIFDTSGTYTPGGGYDSTHVRVDVSALTTAEEVRDALWAVIVVSAEAGDLNVDATQAVATDGIDLANMSSGTFGNVAITETVIDGGFSVTGMSGGAGDLLVLSVAGGEAPSEVAAVGAVTTTGAVVAYNATFGALSLAAVTGKSAVQPANMVLIRDAVTDDPVIWEGKTVYGLLQCESPTDGHAFNDTTQRVVITFVREIDSTTHELGYVKGEAVDGLSLNYAYVVRAPLSALPESAFVEGGFTDLMEGGGGGGGGLIPYHAGDDVTYNATVGQLVTMRGPVP